MSWRIPVTVQNHIWHHTPHPNWSEEREWDWPFWKFDFESPDILFTDLHAQYNSIPCAIQDPYGWWIDVCDIANEAKTRPEFFSLLQKRQEERFVELEKAWAKTRSSLIGNPDLIYSSHKICDMWLRFIRVSRNYSYDSLLGFFGAFAALETKTALLEFNPSEPDSEGENELGRQEQPDRRSTDSEQNTQDFDWEKYWEDRKSRLVPFPESLRRKSAELELFPQSHTSQSRAAAAETSRRATTKPNKVVKRRIRRSKTTKGNPEGLRRSARLQQRAERGKN
ncbi:hypothetical protein GQX73_g7176 [Xylaria multiplex]|uniref:Uncharacterized protein n=1 Tax=Xylaria multiplex TaxID=323545 RepID=A0A7C8MRR1_9PEZI|nr:hypothetical protein GQX73_g7176 [Xylaria multiplex]